MNKKKGFTLIELLAVLVILAILIGLSVGAYVNIREQTLERQYNNVVSRIETAAEKYASETNILRVSVEQLIKEGYLQADDETDIYDPRDKKSLNCRIIDTVFENNEYHATLSEEEKRDETGKCSDYEIKTGEGLIKVECIGSIEEQSICNDAFDHSDGWYRGSVKLSFANPQGKDVKTYRWSSLTGDNSTESFINVSASEKNIKNTQYTVVVSYTDGIVESDNKFIKIDNAPPVIASIKIDKENEWTSKAKNVEITLSDGNGSGVNKIYYTNEFIDVCPTNDELYSELNNNIFSIELDNGKYSVCVKDKVGNISEKASKFEVKMIDDVKPTVNITSTSPKSWVKKLDLKATLTDNETGVVEYAILTKAEPPTASDWKKINKSASYNLSSEIISTGTYYVWAKDEAGNMNYSKKYITNVDGIPPVVHVSNFKMDYCDSYSFSFSGGAWKDESGGSGVDDSGWYHSYSSSSTTAPSYWIPYSSSINDLYCGTRYYMWVKVCDKAGNCGVGHSENYIICNCGEDDGGDYGPDLINPCTPSYNDWICNSDDLCSMYVNSIKWARYDKTGNTSKKNYCHSKNLEIASDLSLYYNNASGHWQLSEAEKTDVFVHCGFKSPSYWVDRNDVDLSAASSGC